MSQKFKVHIRNAAPVEIEALFYRIEDGVLKLQKENGVMIGPSPFCFPVPQYKEVAVFKEWIWVEVVDTQDS